MKKRWQSMKLEILGVSLFACMLAFLVSGCGTEEAKIPADEVLGHYFILDKSGVSKQERLAEEALGMAMEQYVLASVNLEQLSRVDSQTPPDEVIKLANDTVESWKYTLEMAKVIGRMADDLPDKAQGSEKKTALNTLAVPGFSTAFAAEDKATDERQKALKQKLDKQINLHEGNMEWSQKIIDAYDKCPRKDRLKEFAKAIKTDDMDEAYAKLLIANKNINHESLRDASTYDALYKGCAVTKVGCAAATIVLAGPAAIATAATMAEAGAGAGGFAILVGSTTANVIHQGTEVLQGTHELLTGDSHKGLENVQKYTRVVALVANGTSMVYGVAQGGIQSLKFWNPKNVEAYQNSMDSMGLSAGSLYFKGIDASVLQMVIDNGSMMRDSLKDWKEDKKGMTFEVNLHGDTPVIVPVAVEKTDPQSQTKKLEDATPEQLKETKAAVAVEDNGAARAAQIKLTEQRIKDAKDKINGIVNEGMDWVYKASNGMTREQFFDKLDKLEKKTDEAYEWYRDVPYDPEKPSDEYFAAKAALSKSLNDYYNHLTPNFEYIQSEEYEKEFERREQEVQKAEEEHQKAVKENVELSLEQGKSEQAKRIAESIANDNAGKNRVYPAASVARTYMGIGYISQPGETDESWQESATITVNGENSLTFTLHDYAHGQPDLVWTATYDPVSGSGYVEGYAFRFTEQGGTYTLHLNTTTTGDGFKTGLVFGE
ncbi:MAG: hypothetical protein E7201_04970 [Selenomonas ruminantium]|uniref:Uncharacterized protein n=1 Tax=Selenomonas ruminantium TaxID=971 RepID=A0A927WS97_SELRU|nr:hypothetical protein [Selenomonas ruminantium]